jgi:hypothetical protein
MNDPREQFRLTLDGFRSAVQHPAVETFPTLAPILREIEMLVASLDLRRLHNIPAKTMHDLMMLVAETSDHVQFTIDSYSPEEAVEPNGVRRPVVLERNQSNINSRRGQLENLHREILNIIVPIVGLQQMRLLRIAAGSLISLEAERSVSPERGNEVLWRYMPLSNLLRCERAGGLWLSSLERLRAWSSQGAIPDEREGDIPPIVETLKADYWTADAAGAEALDLFREQYGFRIEDTQRVRQAVNFEYEFRNAFVSSWCRRRQESSSLWPAFGDGGRGIALKSTVGKLLTASWRAPVDLFGTTTGNKIRSLVLRDVNYLSFEDDDPVPSIDDLHLPLLKRETFSDEHEIRLLALIEGETAAQGFTLHCNLHEVISEIVVGPNADFETAVAAILSGAPDLSGIPVTKSLLARR